MCFRSSENLGFGQIKMRIKMPGCGHSCCISLFRESDISKLLYSILKDLTQESLLPWAGVRNKGLPCLGARLALASRRTWRSPWWKDASAGKWTSEGPRFPPDETVPLLTFSIRCQRGPWWVKRESQPGIVISSSGVWLQQRWLSEIKQNARSEKSLSRLEESKKER